MTHVVFACVHNAGRSQMAAAFFNRLADPARSHASSAGTAPAASLHPLVVAAMSEVGIDLGHARPQPLTPVVAAGADRIITMGCGELCPAVPGALREDWLLEDPAGQPIERVRAIRDDIYIRVKELVEREQL